MSGRKNVLPPINAVTAGDLSADVTSSWVNIEGIDNVYLQLNTSGSPTGTFTVQVSADKVTAISLSITPALTLSGSAINFGVDLNQLGAPWLRVIYTATSGTGSVTAIVTGKAV